MNIARHTAFGIAAAALLAGCADAHASSAVAPWECGTDTQRLLVVGASPSEQSPAFATFTSDVATAFVSGALVCETPFVVVAATGGSSHVVLAPNDFVGELRLDRLPNQRAKKHRVENRAHDVRSIVDAAFDDARHRLADATTSSIATLFHVTAERAETDARVVMLTDAVDENDTVDLNQPLDSGDGERFAAAIDLPTLPDGVTVTISGVGQVDAAVPAPGSAWTNEVAAFARTACETTGAVCRVFTSASTTEALGH